MNLSLKGKELIAKALIQSRAIFLATVNGMPKAVQDKMDKLIKDFIWNGKSRGLLQWKFATWERKMGGLNMPDINARADAIAIMWIKKWLKPNQEQPLWAKITDEMIRQLAQKKPMIEENSKEVWVMQSWNEVDSLTPTNGKKTPESIKHLLKATRKYNVGLDGLRLAKETKEALPAWHTAGVTHNHHWNKKSARTLRNEYGVRKIKDLDYDFQEKRLNDMRDTIYARMTDFINPMNSSPIKDGLDHTPRRLKKYAEKDIKREPIRFNPDVKEKGDPKGAIRIFGNSMRYKHKRKEKNKMRALQATRKRGLDGQHMKHLDVYTDGSCNNNNADDAIAGAGIWIGKNNKMNAAMRLPGKGRTSQQGELVAILKAVQKIKNPIRILSDSETSVKDLIERIKQWEDIDYIGISNSGILRKIACELSQQLTVRSQ